MPTSEDSQSAGIDITPSPIAHCGLDAERLKDRVVPYMESLVSGGHCPNGMVLAARHGKVAFCQGTGLQNDGSKGSLTEQPTALREDTIFRIYSMSKPITSTALMMLYEEGKFLLTDPAHLYLGPKWKKGAMRVYESGHPTDGDKRGPMKTTACETTVTVLHLLTHTSGLSYGFDVEGVVNPIDVLYAKEGAMGNFSTLLEFGRNLAELPLLFQPGARFLRQHVIPAP